MRRYSASLGNLIGTLPAVIASLKGPLGESVKDSISRTALVERMGEAIQELHQEHGVSEEGLKGVLPSSWVRWALEPQGENGSRQPTVEELAAHDGESTTPRKAQHKLGKVVNKIQLEKFMASLDHLPEEAVPPTREHPFGGSEGKELALARVRSSQGPCAVIQSGTHRPGPRNSRQRVRLRHETGLGDRRVSGDRMSQVPSEQGRRYHHNHACTNLSARWSTGQHA